MEMNFVTIKARIEDARSEEERRRGTRFTVELDARVRELGDEGAEAKVLNISEEGSRSQLYRARVLLQKMLAEN